MITIIVSAVKGGTGKTKVTANLGKAFARLGKRVALLDLDYFGPTLNVELGVTDALEGDGHGHVIPSRTKEGCQFVSFGQVYIRDQAVTVAEDSAGYEISQVLRDGCIKWANPDYLFVDTAPTSSGVIQASLVAPDLLGTIIVSQPSSGSRADLLRSLSLMKDKRVPVLGIVINQGYYICPQCGSHSPIYDLMPADIEAAVKPWGVPILGVIPHSANLDSYFDALTLRVMGAIPVTIAEDKKVSTSRRRLLSWIGNLLPSPTTRSK